jgi:hypothetical protein
VIAVIVYTSYFRPTAAEVFLKPSPQSEIFYRWLPGVYRPVPEIFYDRQVGLNSVLADDPGSAAIQSCALIFLSQSSPFTRCSLSSEEWQKANDHFGSGWQSVWVVRPGKLGLGPTGVFGAVRQSQVPSVNVAAAEKIDAETEWASWKKQRIRACRDLGCQAIGGANGVWSVHQGIEIVGWVALMPGKGEPAAILLMNGKDPVAKVALGSPRVDVAKAQQRPELLNSGFRVVVPTSSMIPLVGNGESPCKLILRVVDAEGPTFSDLSILPEVCYV